MPALTSMTEDDRARVSAAVTQAELASAGEIVTILAERSDDYGDAALAWSALAGLLALLALAIAPGFYLDIYAPLTGGWVHEWTPARVFGVALLVVPLKFTGVWLILRWRRLRLWLTPRAIRNARVHARAVACFKVGAERRTVGRTGILIYLSLAERRAEILADEAIAKQVSAEVWGDALGTMLAQLSAGRTADGLIAAIEQVGAVLAHHFPRSDTDDNELPDRLIEV